MNQILKMTKLIAPWLITALALYFAFRQVEWEALLTYLQSAELRYIWAAIGLTCLSYLFRARRWQFLFPSHPPEFHNAASVLILGFFMNNILPARAGEFVRAHLGSKKTGHTRTLVLATIATERLIDGLTLSLMFLLATFASSTLGNSPGLNSVAWFFVVATVGVGVVLILRAPIFRLAASLNTRINHRLAHYAFERFQVFINGLAPLFALRRLPYVVLWSIAIWLVELCVYMAIARGFSAALSPSLCILFMVTVNFSSLIPAAPGGMGVIEAFASSVLVSFGVDREHALAMVITQHIIQYLVVCIPGALVLLSSRNTLPQAADPSHG